MKISRSGYYKWLKNKDILNNYEILRNDMCKLVKEYHKKHPSWGYRHINRQIRVDIGWYVSDNFVHKRKQNDTFLRILKNLSFVTACQSIL